jgi:hypothetical protein
LAGKAVKDALAYLCDAADHVPGGNIHFVRDRWWASPNLADYWAGGCGDHVHSAVSSFVTVASSIGRTETFMNAKPIIHVGIALMLLGIATFAYQGIGYTSREKVIGIGPLQGSVDANKIVPLSPLVAGLMLVGGIVLVVVGIKKSS